MVDTNIDIYIYGPRYSPIYICYMILCLCICLYIYRHISCLYIFCLISVIHVTSNLSHCEELYGIRKSQHQNEKKSSYTEYHIHRAVVVKHIHWNSKPAPFPSCVIAFVYLYLHIACIHGCNYFCHIHQILVTGLSQWHTDDSCWCTFVFTYYYEHKWNTPLLMHILNKLCDHTCILCFGVIVMKKTAPICQKNRLKQYVFIVIMILQ